MSRRQRKTGDIAKSRNPLPAQLTSHHNAKQIGVNYVADSRQIDAQIKHVYKASSNRNSAQAGHFATS